MKIPCPVHGAHFGDETEEIMACPIIWRRWNMQELPTSTRQEILDWYLDFPADKVFIETGWGISLGMMAEYIGYEKALASSTEYEKMSEEDRREYQRQELKQRYQKGRKKSLWQKLRRK